MQRHLKGWSNHCKQPMTKLLLAKIVWISCWPSQQEEEERSHCCTQFHSKWKGISNKTSLIPFVNSFADLHSIHVKCMICVCWFLFACHEEHNNSEAWLCVVKRRKHLEILSKTGMQKKRPNKSKDWLSEAVLLAKLSFPQAAGVTVMNWTPLPPASCVNTPPEQGIQEVTVLFCSCGTVETMNCFNCSNWPKWTLSTTCWTTVVLLTSTPSSCCGENKKCPWQAGHVLVLSAPANESARQLQISEEKEAELCASLPTVPCFDVVHQLKCEDVLTTVQRNVRVVSSCDANRWQMVGPALRADNKRTTSEYEYEY